MRSRGESNIRIVSEEQAYALASAAEFHPERTALYDELGEVTFSELDRQARLVAGVGLGCTVGAQPERHVVDGGKVREK